MSCSNGHLEVAMLLLEIKPDIEISIKKEFSFRMACYEGHLKIAI
jgi:hypothetical protein